MKTYHFIIVSLLISLYSCSYAPSTRGPITIVQLKSLDFTSIRPRLVTLLGTDSSGLEALSMITEYEEFLLDHYPKDTSYERIPEDPSLYNWDDGIVGAWQLEREKRGHPKFIQKPGPPTKLFLQILHQNLLKWMNELDKYHSEYIYTQNLGVAKKGAAAGYNALISGPSVNDIQKITDSMQQLIDSLYTHQK